MKLLLLLICTFFLRPCYGQKVFVKQVELAENHFALESQIIGLKAGFLKNMDTSAIGVNKNGFISLFKSWSERQELKSTLLWEPKSVFASEDGLWGSTHGPWYTRDSLGNLVNPGYFFTIWQRKSKNEAYKFSLDIGIQLDNAASIVQAVSLPLHTFSIPSKFYGQNQIDMGLSLDFISTSSSISLRTALEKYAIKESAILVSGKGRVLYTEFKKLSSIHKPFRLTRVKTILLSKDFAFYEFGTLAFENTAGETKAGQYVHVWSMYNKKTSLITALYKWD